MFLLRIFVGILVLSVFALPVMAQDEPIPPGWIVFEARTGTLTHDLFRMLPDGSNLQRLTDSPETESRPVWSPDGEWIAFVREQNLYRMRADGSEQQWLAALLDPPDSGDNWCNPAEVVWSPDGEWIVFEVCADSYMDLYRIRSNGSDLQRLTDRPGREMDAAWSPDGEWIVFEVNENGDSDLYRMRPDGSEQQRLTNNPEKDWMAAWSPDSQWIVFVSLENGSGQIYRMRPDGSEQQHLDTPDDARSPEWSPDGEWIAFFTFANYADYLYRMRSDGSDLQFLCSLGIGGNMDWSPDSEWIVFQNRMTGGHIDICRIGVDGTDHQCLTTNPDIDLNPQWSPLVEVD